MSFRFHQRISLFPGVRLNLSPSGISVSVGVPGATVNFGGNRGSSVTLGIPGTGLSYRHQLGGEPQKQDGSEHLPLQPEMRSGSDLEQSSLPGEIKSADVSLLTTQGLQDLKRLLNDAAMQRRNFQASVSGALQKRDEAWRTLERARKFPLKLFKSRSVPALEIAFQTAQDELEGEVEKLNACFVQVDFAFDEVALNAYDSLVKVHEELRVR